MNLPNFKNPPSLLKATYLINTPMFSAGASVKEAELTPTTFKGIMRFWWRALNWSQIRIDSPNDIEALKELHRQESRLFGVAANNDREYQGQGACSINSLSSINLTEGNSESLLKIFNVQKNKKYNNKKEIKEDVFPISSGLGYLLGQGLYDYKKGIQRGVALPLQTFSVEFTVESSYHEEVTDALKLIGLLGGFGSRSRHGLGSVTLKEISTKTVQDENYNAIDIEVSNVVSAINELLARYDCKKNEKLPPISAFYAGTRIDVINNYKEDAISLLDELGKEQQMYRSYGRNKKVNGKRAEQNFKDDHDLMIQISDRSYHGVPSHPKRVVCGLPHNYFYSSGLKVNVDASTGRRSSPLFFHVHRENNSYQLISCLFKSKFLPDDASIDFSTNRRSANVDVDWNVITDFMDRAAFANKETL